MSKELKIDYGTCWPDEYDWETQFAEALNGAYGFVTVDAGKLRGVALAYKELRESKRLVFVGLTDEEVEYPYPPAKPPVYATAENTKSVRDGYEMGGYEIEPGYYSEQQLDEFAKAIEAKLKEKNT